MTITSWIQRIIAMAAVAALLGCASGRFADLQDCAKFSVGIGTTLTADVKLGPLTHPSLDLSFWQLAGIPPINFGIGHECRGGSGIMAGGLAGTPMIYLHRHFDSVELPDPPGISIVRGFGWSRSDNAWGISDQDHWIYPYYSRRKPTVRLTDWTDLQAGVSALAYVHVGVNPLEMVDFLLGFGGIDIAHDDPRPPEEVDDE